MKYRVRIAWQTDIEVEAESKDDAINMAMHGTKKPKPVRVSAQMLNPNHRQVAKAIPRWRQWHEWRKSGMKLREIAQKAGRHIATVHIGITKFESYLITQKAA